MTLRVALVGGPMYDGLYRLLPDDAEIVLHADHPTLNRRVARLLAAGERIDLLCTHSKYAPSQSHHLLALDDLVDPAALAALAGRARELCRFDGALWCVPRNVDVRTLWWRVDRLDAPPDTWTDVLGAGERFGFTGRESGLFGLFYELVVGSGGRLMTAAVPDTEGWVGACEAIAALGAVGPPDLPHWHYDDVDAALGNGRVAMAGAWPGGTAALRAAPMGSRLRPAPYPAGSAARVSYAGCHAWAIPSTAVDPERSAQIISALISLDASLVDARAGTIPANDSALAAIEPVDGVDAERLSITAATIADAMITYPPLRDFPAIEDASWGALHELLLGHVHPRHAAAVIERAVRAALDPKGASDAITL